MQGLLRHSASIWSGLGGLPYPTAGLDVIVYNSTYEDGGTTYLRTSKGIGIPKVSGTGLDTIWDFSVLNDVRFDKGSYVGNAFGLPATYNFPYVGIYYDATLEATRYHWKITDFAYAVILAQSLLVDNMFFLKAKATTNTSNIIATWDRLFIYSTALADNNLSKMESYIGIGKKMAYYNGTSSYCQLASPITVDRTKNTIFEIAYKRGNKTINLEAIIGNQLTDYFSFILFNAGAVLFETGTNDDRAIGVLNNDDNNYHTLVININNSIVSMSQDGVAMTMSDNTISDNFTFSRFGKCKSLRFYLGNIESVKVTENTVVKLNIPDLTTGVDISGNNNNATCFNITITPFYKS